MLTAWTFSFLSSFNKSAINREHARSRIRNKPVMLILEEIKFTGLAMISDNDLEARFCGL